MREGLPEWGYFRSQGTREMTRAKLIIWTGTVIRILFILCVASLIVGHGGNAQYWRTVHQIAGMLLSVGCLVHLSLHWNWIRAVLIRPPTSLSSHARIKRRVDIWLLCTFFFCGFTGVVNWLAPGRYPGHFPHNWNGLHHLSGIAMIILIIVHLALHWDWLMHTFFPLSTK
jgi:cytochrome c oxidase subunit IV